MQSPIIKWVGGDKPYLLTEDHTFRTRQGTWTVPANYRFDGASVPRIPFVYARYGNTAHEAACLHDYLYQCQPCTREQADKAFLEVMEQFDNPPSCTQRKAMYRALRLFGWIAWNKHKK